MWWSKEKGLQIEDLGSRIWSTHKKFRQIDRQTNRETDISSIRHTSHSYTFTIYCLVLYNEWTDLTSFLFLWDALDNLYKLWTMTIVQNFKSFTSFQQAFLGKKKVSHFLNKTANFCKNPATLPASLGFGCLIRENCRSVHL